ncbi:ABC-three component system protein [Pseudomonas argentinensis]|uniref:ABC-three component system protein n=1 Tax=Phytopseudomonas argentinensis TaxID=289370 RepID=UPI0009F3602E|nr:ABC-three component system protein [Pseudomonas argentinensis]
MLYAETGGICPLCSCVIIDKKPGSKNPSKFYDVAHIYPLNPTPAQSLALANHIAPTDINGLSNVICLCPSCHKKFDKDFKIEEYDRLRAIKDAFISNANARKSISEHSLRVEIRELIEAFCDLDDESLVAFDVELNAHTLSEKLKKGASNILKRNIRNDVVGYFVTIREELRILEQRDQAAVKMLLNQINTYFWAMHKEHPGNKDVIFNYIAQWISQKSGKSLDVSKIMTSFFVQNCEVFDVSAE